MAKSYKEYLEETYNVKLEYAGQSFSGEPLYKRQGGGNSPDSVQTLSGWEEDCQYNHNRYGHMM